MTFAPGGEWPATAPAGPSSLMRSPSIRIAWLVRTAPARASTRRPALTRTVWGAGGAVGACAGSRTVTASAMSTAATRARRDMTTSEAEVTKRRSGVNGGLALRHRLHDSVREHIGARRTHAGGVALQLIAVGEHRFARRHVQQLGGQDPDQIAGLHHAAGGHPVGAEPPPDWPRATAVSPGSSTLACSPSKRRLSTTMAGRAARV